LLAIWFGLGWWLPLEASVNYLFCSFMAELVTSC
jgi:hypothetical protein